MEKRITAPKFTAFFTLLLFTGTFLMATQGREQELDIAADITHISCPGNTTGEIKVTVTGGTFPYTYSWYDSNGQTIVPDVEETPNILTNLPAGTYHLTVTDDSGTPKSLELTINEEDSDPPEITEPGIISLVAASGECAASTEITVPETSDNCGLTEITGIRNDGEDLSAPFPVGETVITWTAVDSSNNTTSVTQRITVAPSNPNLLAPDDISINTSEISDGCATTLTLGTPTLEDSCGAFEIMALVDGEPIDPTTYLFPTGSTIVTWRAKDEFNNSYSNDQEVEIVDNEDPTIPVLSDITIPANQDSCAATAAALEAPEASDNCEIASITNNAPESLPIGDTEVIWTATDTSGNQVSTSQTIKVEDQTPPTVVAQAYTFYLDEDGQAALSQEDLAAITQGSFDNCELSLVEFAPEFENSFTCEDLGQIAIPIVATDVYGNTSQITAEEVTLEDNTKPVISEVQRIVAETDAGSCSASEVLIEDPTVSDNCNSISPVATRSDGEVIDAPYPLGTTYITWTATDASGNEAVPVKQTIVVEDRESPAIPELEDFYVSCEFTFPIPTTTDNSTCSDAGRNIEATTEDPITYSPQNNNTSHTVTWVFEDRFGNTSEVEQTVHITPLFIDLETQPVSCHGGSDGSIEIIGSGGKGTFTYALGDNQFTSNPLKTGLRAGNYVAKVKDENGCVVQKNIQITEPADLKLEVPEGEEKTSTTAESCYGANDGTISLNGIVSGGTGNYLYSVDNITFTSEPVIRGLSSGFYEVFIKDSNDCSLSGVIEATVEGPEELQADVILENPVSCHGESDGRISISNPSGGNGNTYSFRINGQEWNTNANASGFTFTNLPTGNYKIEMKDDTGGCVKVLDESFQLTQPNPIQANLSASATTSYGSATGSVTASPTGGNGNFKYSWINAQGVEVADTRTATGLVAGIYQVIITDSKSCTTPEVAEIEVLDKLTSAIIDDTYCVDQEEFRTSVFQVDLENTNGGSQENPALYTYTWDFGEVVEIRGFDTPTQTVQGSGPFVVKFPTSGTKSVAVTVVDGSESETFSVSHHVGNCEVSCGDGTTQNFNGDPNSFFLGDADGNKIEANCGTAEEMYIWFKVANNSNVKTLYTKFTYVVSSATSTKQESLEHCNYSTSDFQTGSLVRLNKIGTGEDEVNWNCNDLLSIQHMTYRYSQKIENDCKSINKDKWCLSTNEEITVATPIGANVSQTFPTCYGESKGSIIIDAYGGTGNFEYIAENEAGETIIQDSNVFLELPAGIYSITVNSKERIIETNAEGQQYDAGPRISFPIPGTIEVEEPAQPLEATIEIIQNETCHAADDGIAQVNVTGGTPHPDTNDYSYLWNDVEGQTKATAENLKAGTYTVTITDHMGCSLVKTIEISQPPKVSEAVAGTGIISCGFTTTTLNGNAPASDEIGTWSIISGEGGDINESQVNSRSAEFTGKAGEIYTLRWTISKKNGEGCPSESDVEVKILADCNYLDFDGVDDYIDFGDNFGFESGSFSMEAWVKLKSTAGTKTVLSKKSPNDAADQGYELVIASGAPAIRWQGKSITPNRSNLLNTQRWYHLAVTYDSDSTKVKLFVDGIEVNNEIISNPGGTTAPFMIGATSGSGGSMTKPNSHFRGWIQEVRLWNTALSVNQIRFMMNQQLEEEEQSAEDGTSTGTGFIKGTVLPLRVPGDLQWNELEGYYQLLTEEAKEGDGTTIDRSYNEIHGVLKNITSFQENTAPLPYKTRQNGYWSDIEYESSPWLYSKGTWDSPNSVGINNEPINWNIVKTSHDLSSGNKNITLLGLLSQEGALSIEDPNRDSNEYNRGHSLRVTHYLDLDGSIDLEGESQLLQDEGSILEEGSSGYILRGQQGTASSYNYNYWSSPVSTQGEANNSGYSIAGVLRDGTDPENPGPISFNYSYSWADGNYTGPKRISSYWLNIYTNNISGTYSQWEHVGQNGHIQAGEGYTMKGTSGSAKITDPQNYIFKGKPNNGTIKLKVDTGNDYLVGNPYPSALDGYEFIRDNIRGRRDGNVFNGSLYFWDHFSGKTHYLQQYVGGYATLNLSGGVVAVATDERINATGEFGDPEKIPQQFIPVGQAFYVSTNLAEPLAKLESVSGGDILFKNSQRTFETDDQEGDESVFKNKEEKEENLKKEDQRQKIYITFSSPGGYHRQLLVTKDEATTTGFDLGYDAPLIDNVADDMYWIIEEVKFVIQGVPDFAKERTLPLGVKLKSDGEISIGLGVLKNIPEKFKIFLKDSLLETVHDLRVSDYVAEVSAGNTEDRFEVVFQKNNSEEENPEPDGSEEDGQEGEDNSGTDPGDSGEDGQEGEDHSGSDPGDSGEDGQEGEDNSGTDPGDSGEDTSSEENPEPDETEAQEENSQEIGIIFLQSSQELLIHNPGKMQINRVRLLNILGQEMKVFTSLSNDENQRYSLRALHYGTYIVEVQTVGNKYNKIIILTM